MKIETYTTIAGSTCVEVKSTHRGRERISLTPEQAAIAMSGLEAVLRLLYKKHRESGGAFRCLKCGEIEEGNKHLPSFAIRRQGIHCRWCVGVLAPIEDNPTRHLKGVPDVDT